MSEHGKAIFQRVPDGRLLAIRNWRHRKKKDDALVAVPLSEDELARYRRLKEGGHSDEWIFDELFPVPPNDRVALSMDQLTKGQLLQLAYQIMGHELPSMERMTQPDLADLLRTLCKGHKKCQAYLV